jgi:hypothetical protein
MLHMAMRSAIGRQTAHVIHHEVLPGYLARTIADEKTHHVREVPRRRDPTQRRGLGNS